MTDSDNALNQIYQACVDAGPSTCPLYESSADKVSARVDKLLDSLKTQPLSFFNSTINDFGVLDYSTAKFAVLQTIYKPYNVVGGGASLLSAIAAAEQGEGRPLYDTFIGAPSSSPFECPTSAVDQVSFASGLESQWSVRCGDLSRPPLSLDELKANYAETEHDSHFFGEAWHFNLGCA